MSKARTLSWVALLFVAIAAQFTSAAVPQLVSYQGRLTNGVGSPLDTTVSLIFTIYADSAATIQVWSETHPSVVITDGLFHALLGNISTLDENVFSGQKRWLRVQMQDGPAPTASIPIVTVPYAYRAAKSDTASYALAGPGGGGNGWEDIGTVVRLATITDSVGIGIAAPKARLHVGFASTDKLMAQIEGLTVIRTNGSGQPTNIRLVNLNALPNSGTSLDFQGMNSSATTKDAARISGYFKDQTVGAEKSALTLWTNDVADDGFAERVRIDHDGNVGIGTALPDEKLHVVGNIRSTATVKAPTVDLGSMTETGAIYLRGPLNPAPGYYGAIGETPYGSGSLILVDSGYTVAGLGKSGSGRGGDLYLSDEDGGTIEAYSGFTAKQPLFSISGASRSAVFDMSQSGNSSVVLPASAIDQTEIFNEAGLSNSRHTTGSIALDNTIQTILTRRSVYPSDGWVLSIATANIALTHTQGTTDVINLAITEATGTIPSDQNYSFGLSANVPSGTFSFPITIHGYVSVSGGLNNMYLVAQLSSGASAAVGDAGLTVVFFPTNYLSLMKTDGVSDNAEQDERDAAAIAQMNERIELMKKDFDARLEEVKKEMAKRATEGNRSEKR